jgi:deoxyhypusine synthase
MLDLTNKNNQIQLVATFKDLVDTSFGGNINALCWQRLLEGDFFEIIEKIKPRENITYIEPDELIALELSEQGNLARQTILVEWDLLENHYNRVTDTCIPEEEAFRRLQKHIHKIWKDADTAGERYFPHEYMYKILLSGELEQYYEIDPKDSWMLAAAQKNIPIVVPGWEDSTMGNIFASYVIKNEIKASTMKSGIEYMTWLADWYVKNSEGKGVGFFQIGGGIAGDFPICVVPMLYQDMEMENIPFWSYFCQISDSTTSYGSYSGAVPNEKITWGKLDIHTPKFIVESDATIVAPLMFAWILGW